MSYMSYYTIYSYLAFYVVGYKLTEYTSERMCLD